MLASTGYPAALSDWFVHTFLQNNNKVGFQTIYIQKR